MLTIDSYKKMPGSMGTNVTEIPEQFREPEKSETHVNASGGFENTVNIDDAIKSTDHTRVSPLNLMPSGQPQPLTQNPNNSTALGSMLESKMAIELIDAVLPGLLVAGLHAVQIKLKKSELQLTEKEKNTIAPIFQKCLDTIYLNFNSPWTLLAVTVGVIYGSKVAEKGIVAYIDKERDKKEIESQPKFVATPEGEIFNQSDNTILEKITELPKQEKPPPIVPWKVTEAKLRWFQKYKKVNRSKALMLMNRMIQQGQPDPTI